MQQKHRKMQRPRIAEYSGRAEGQRLNREARGRVGPHRNPGAWGRGRMEGLLGERPFLPSCGSERGRGEKGQENEDAS